MNNNIDSKISFQADLCIKHLGRHNTKMKSVAKNFKVATPMYPNDKFCIDNFGFYGEMANFDFDIPFTEKGMKILLKSSEEEITKASVKLFKILKKVVNKTVRVIRSTDYLLDEKNTTLSSEDISQMDNLISMAVSSAQKTEFINKTKKDKILKHINYNEINITNS